MGNPTAFTRSPNVQPQPYRGPGMGQNPNPGISGSGGVTPGMMTAGQGMPMTRPNIPPQGGMMSPQPMAPYAQPDLGAALNHYITQAR